MKLENLEDDKGLVVKALNALRRKRTQAYDKAVTLSQLNKTALPNDFGVAEVDHALRRILSS
ncbi:MAG: hypothetical protein EOO52_13130 [Gammaproteobacteria bacterium]|nr:MAG: hypothetical protein EOO52_13130 [Gammaproteobacteria bacterium]